MTNRANDPGSLDPIGHDEIDALFGEANPNPSRADCPAKEVLLALARRERAIDDPAYEHLTRCSPCYREFRALQATVGVQEAGGRYPRWWVAASAAALLILIAVGVWLYLYTGSPPGDRVRVPVIAEADARIDLRPYAVARSEQKPVGLPPIALSSQRLRVTVLLPTGSEPGPYALRLLDSASREVISATAIAEIRDFVTTLQTTVDLRSLPAGDYQLGVRRQGEDWHSYPVSVR
jgi:hypothetical protein